ncbi:MULTISPECIES: glycoside hydrolase family 5 protein [unclassified Fibrobacter]|uniref:glycoside hydrolase family 5 protein n=1 Tax=unclassified Fibrobacter TaxID=2634177 RepID=UPI00091486A8|nr:MULTISPECIES: cellulase family glycosylhydrolase [unclassified Fibrobacter]SHK98732.1 endoglucanase [Fibrobacter sp. UWB12]SIO41562.1 endoglucanase [Fibrobacter sp. UWB11]
MFKKVLSSLAIGCALGCSFWACDSGSATIPTAPTTTKATPVDYTLGRTMNAILGRGINLGNSWDSEGADDSGWGNPINDGDFAIIKAAGFNSVRIPVRWQYGSDYGTHTVDPDRLNGVLADIRLAIANGLAVVVNFHHYVELNCAGGGGTKSDGSKCKYDANEFTAEKAHFLALWAQVAAAMAEFPDNMVVLEILNEPSIPNATLVDQLMNEAYTVIRTYAPGKTIMFETYHLAKFEDIESLHMPADGNIIFSGHYYLPYNYSHEGHGYECKGDATLTSTAVDDFAYYVSLAYKFYPDINGIDHIPMNMGEFGVAGGDNSPCQWQQGDGPSETGKAYWAEKTAKVAVQYGISFHYWSFGQTGGFQAFDGKNWLPGFPESLIF